jgi:hypothetical protein
MHRWVTLTCIAIAAGASLAPAAGQERGAPNYQRQSYQRQNDWRQGPASPSQDATRREPDQGPPHGGPDRPTRPPNDRPNHFPNHRTDHRPNPGRQAPSVESGTFQRPYPFHLDYYKQKFGGSYDPYFGNLYGPPNVVLANPWNGFGFAPGAGVGFGEQGNWVQPPYSNSFQPQTGPGMIVCPHCQQPIYFSTPGEFHQQSPIPLQP